MGEQPVPGAVERRLGRVVDRQLALAGEQRRPPAGTGRELDDLPRDRQRVEPSPRGVKLGVPGGVVDRAAFVATPAQVPVVVFGCARLVVRDQVVIGGVRGCRTRARRDGDARTAPFRDRVAEAEAQEAVVAGLADAGRAELRPALDVVGAAAGVGGPAPQAVERRAERHARSGLHRRPGTGRPAVDERFGVENLGEELDAVEDARPRPAEIGRAVHREHLAAADRR